MANALEYLTETAAFAAKMLELNISRHPDTRMAVSVSGANRILTHPLAERIRLQREDVRGQSHPCLRRPLAAAGYHPGQWYYEHATPFEPDLTPPRLTL